MLFDEFLTRTVGGAGFFQVFLALLMSIYAILTPEAISDNFVAGDQEHWCRIEALTNLPHDQQRYIAIPSDADGYSSCYAFNISYDAYTTTDFYYWNRTLHETDDVIPCTDWVYDQSQYVSTITSEWDLVCDNAWKVPFISTAVMLGYLFGSLFSGPLSDKYGRIPVILGSSAVRLVGDLMSCFAPTYAVFATGRFLTGIGTVAYVLSGFVYMVEVVGASSRLLFNLVVGSAVSLFFVSVTLYAYIIRDHVLLQLVILIPIFANFLTYGIMYPESPRWLLTVKKTRRAESNLRKMAAINGRPWPADLDIATIEISQQAKAKTQTQTKTQTQVSRTSTDNAWMKVLRSRKLLIRILVLFLNWFTTSLVSWAFTFNVDALPGNLYVNTLIYAVFDVIGAGIGFLGVRSQTFGRRLTLGLSMICAFITNGLTIPFIIFGLDVAITTMSMLGRICLKVSWSVLFVYTVELLPTEIRNGGMGFASVGARISGMIAPFFGSTMASILPSLPSAIFAATSLVCGVLTITQLPETLGKQLPDTVDELLAEKSGKSRANSTATANGVSGVNMTSQSSLDNSFTDISEVKTRL